LKKKLLKSKFFKEILLPLDPGAETDQQVDEVDPETDPDPQPCFHTRITKFPILYCKKILGIKSGQISGRLNI
jgi:hypothetical protein